VLEDEVPLPRRGSAAGEEAWLQGAKPGGGGSGALAGFASGREEAEEAEDSETAVLMRSVERANVAGEFTFEKLHEVRAAGALPEA
jgi:hypothetical protein